MALRKLKPIEERDPYAAAVLEAFDKLEDKVLAVGRKYERNGIVLIVDAIQNGEVFYRRWRSGSDGSANDDWFHYIGANRMSEYDFQKLLNVTE